MQALFLEHGGDYSLVIRDYVKAERKGVVPRKSLVMSPEEYADRLWRDGVGRGWLDASKTTWGLRREGGVQRISHSSVRETPGAKVKQANSLPSFDSALREMGEFWRTSSLRPHPSPSTLAYWSGLIEAWVADPTMPLLVRKGTMKTLRCVHPEGRVFVRCDNSPAHWAFMGAYLDERPTLEEIREQLTLGHVPMALARTREESKRIADGLDEAMGGHLGQSRYGQVNRFPNGMSYKLCHLEGVGLKSRGDVQELPVASLKAHMRRFLDPTNMIVVPLEYAGVGECAAFLEPFVEAAKNG